MEIKVEYRSFECQENSTFNLFLVSALSKKIKLSTSEIIARKDHGWALLRIHNFRRLNLKFLNYRFKQFFANMNSEALQKLEAQKLMK